MNKADVAIIGGGIIGLATAYQLTRKHPGRRVVILEKEAELAYHQTGHNSGVLHSGIYYKPGSLKAVNCRAGKKALEAFCEQEDIPYDICGKVIVAVDESELERLGNIYIRGQQNGVKCELIDADRLHELEPHAAGIRAVHVPEAGIVDFKRVCERFAEHVRRAEGTILTGAQVTAIEHVDAHVVLMSTAGDVEADYVINCAGLHCDRVARLENAKPQAGAKPQANVDVKIVPFRGEYFDLKPAAHHLCQNLIYPVPDPSFPFLGVHFTRMIHGGVECGPNAVLALAREGYRKTDINLRDLCESLTYPGFLRLAARHWKMGLEEMWRSVSKRAFVRALGRLIPDIRAEHLEAAPAGVRAQALLRDGNLVDDFLIHETARVINVLNAPSPAATSSLNIGRLIVEKLATRF